MSPGKKRMTGMRKRTRRRMSGEEGSGMITKLISARFTVKKSGYGLTNGGTDGQTFL